MNKHQEAYDKVTNAIRLGKFDEDISYYEDIECNMVTIKELVDKETPMKLKPSGENCGRCNGLVYREYEKQCENYCDNCGQKLDWADEDE